MQGLALTPRRAATAAAVALVIGSAANARADDDAHVAPVQERPDLPGADTLKGAEAVPRRRLGEAGAIVLDDLLGLGLGPGIGSAALGVGTSSPMMTGWIRYEEVKAEQQGLTMRSTTLALAPTVDVFVTRGLSIGTQAMIFHTSLRAGAASSAFGGGIRPRIGWAIPIADGLMLWARVFGSIAATYAKSDGATLGATQLGAPIAGATQTGVTWGFGSEAMLVAPIGRVVALTFGPSIAYGKTDVIHGDPGSSRSGVSLGVHGGIAFTL